jgi:cobalt-zinc-cadmium efflux system membrane fusion protein
MAARTLASATLVVVALAAGATAQNAAAEAARAVVAAGRVRVEGANLVHVSPPLTGRVKRILVRLGQPVAKGAPLAVISSDLASALSDELTAEADLAAAGSAYRRGRRLYRVHAETEAELDAARTARRAARAALQRLRANVSLLELDHGHGTPLVTVVRAPVTGHVLEVAVKPGDAVGPRGRDGAATRMFAVGDVERAWVVAAVSARELASLREGEPVTVRELGHPVATFAGRVARISRSVDPAAGTATVWCAMADPRGLRPGANATVVIGAR